MDIDTRVQSQRIARGTLRFKTQADYRRVSSYSAYNLVQYHQLRSCRKTTGMAADKLSRQPTAPIDWVCGRFTAVLDTHPYISLDDTSFMLESRRSRMAVKH
jgi:hypothetical protein